MGSILIPLRIPKFHLRDLLIVAVEWIQVIYLNISSNLFLGSCEMITPTQAVQTMFDTFTKLTEKDAGCFMESDGTAIPW